MEASEAFNLTLSTFDIKPSDLAKGTGIAESTISSFRHGNRDLRISSLQKLAAAFPIPAKMYFYSLLSSDGSLAVAKAS
jgi:transcriptional regulator with XRE-family HTH domain